MLFSQAEIVKLSDEQKRELIFGEDFSSLPPPCPVAIVLGSGVEEMRSRATSAAALAACIPVGKFIVCGGVAREFCGKRQAECRILHDLLREAGVTAEIVQERSSKDTIENILYAFTLFKNDLLSQKRLNVAVVTSPWHLRRAAALARCLLPRTVSVYGYHAGYDAQRLAWARCPELRERAENELRFLQEAIGCGFAEDFEI